MTGAAAEAFFLGAIDLVELAVKEINAAIARGEVSVEKQAELKQRVDSFRQATAFEGEEWKIMKSEIPSSPPVPNS